MSVLSCSGNFCRLKFSVIRVSLATSLGVPCWKHSSEVLIHIDIDGITQVLQICQVIEEVMGVQ